MVVTNKKNKLNFGKNTPSEICINTNLKRWFSRNIGLWKSNRSYFLNDKQKTYNLIITKFLYFRIIVFYYSGIINIHTFTKD